MPKYVIERTLPGAGNLTAEELQGISRKSCGMLEELGPQVNWVHSSQIIRNTNANSPRPVQVAW